jgi:predicted amidohydrolase YtcJ
MIAHDEFVPRVAGNIEQLHGDVEGVLADVVVLSKDVFKEPVEKVRDFEVVTTIFDGKVVYERETR